MRPCAANRSRTERAAAPESPATARTSREGQPALPADEGEGPGPGLVEVNPENRLEPELFLGQQLLVRQGQFEGFPRPVVVDDRGHAPEPLPIAEDRANAGSGLLAQTDAAECGDDPRVADLFLHLDRGAPGRLRKHRPDST